MTVKYNALILIFILAFSLFTVQGNFHKAYGYLTPVADLSGEWSGFGQFEENSRCRQTVKINVHIDQNENELSGTYSFVSTGSEPMMPDVDCSNRWDPTSGDFSGILDGSRISITLSDDGLEYSGSYTGSGIKISVNSDWLVGSIQLSPTGFSPPKYQSKDTGQGSQSTKDREQASQPPDDGEQQVLPPQNEQKDSDGDGIIDSMDYCPHEKEDYVGEADGCPEIDKGTQQSTSDSKQEPSSQQWAEDDNAKSTQTKLDEKINDMKQTKTNCADWADGCPVEADTSPLAKYSRHIVDDQVVWTDQNGVTVTLADMEKNPTFFNAPVYFKTEKYAELHGTNVDLKFAPDTDAGFLIFRPNDEPKESDNFLKNSLIMGGGGAVAGLWGYVSSAMLLHPAIATMGGVVIFAITVGSIHAKSTHKSEETSDRIYVTKDAVLKPKGTEFTLTVKDGVTIVNVFEGQVSLYPIDEKLPETVVDSGESLQIAGQKITKSKLDVNSVNDWWNSKTKQVMQQSNPAKKGCLIATAAYGTELAPQVQILREVRDNVLLSTNSGKSFMSGFNEFYYSFSPTIADWERQNLIFKDTVKITLTPLLSTLSILNYADIHSEQQVLGYGIGIILLNLGMYIVAPAILIFKINGRINRKH